MLPLRFSDGEPRPCAVPRKTAPSHEAAQDGYKSPDRCVSLPPRALCMPVTCDIAISVTSGVLARPECEAVLAFRCVHLSPEFVICDHSALVCEVSCNVLVFSS